MRIIVLAIGLLIVSGCPKRITYKPLPKERGAEVVQALREQANRKQSLSGLFGLQGSGIGEFGPSAELDVVAQRPGQLYIAVRSFFNQPLQVMTFDGRAVYELDLGKRDEPRYHSFLASHGQSDFLGPLSLKPRDAVDIIFGSAPLGGEIVDIKISEDGKEYAIDLKKKNGTRLVLSLLTDLTLTGFTMTTAQGAITEVIYDNFELANDISFPRRFRVRHQKDSQRYDVTFKVKQIELNQKTLPISTFRIEPPL